MDQKRQIIASWAYDLIRNVGQKANNYEDMWYEWRDYV